MEHLDLLNKYAELTEAWMKKKVQLENFMSKVVSGEKMNSESVRHLVNSTNKEIDELQAVAQQQLEKFLSTTLAEVRKNAEKSAQDVNVAYGVNAEVVQENTQGGMKK